MIPVYFRITFSNIDDFRSPQDEFNERNNALPFKLTGTKKLSVMAD